MKKITVAFSAIFILLTTITHAQKNEKLEFTKERAISKTYPASGNSLTINNIFGHVKINAWDKNEVKVDVQIKVASSDKEQAERTFENISVDEGLTGNNIKFKTSTSDKKSDRTCKNCNTNMRIDYEVWMPVNIPLHVANSFGNIEIPDYKGAATLQSKFGKLTAGTLTDVKLVSVEFGTGLFKSLSDITATFKFSKIQIAELGGSNKVNLEFCDSSKIIMSGNLTALSLNESYSTVNLRPASGLGVTYDIRTSFGTFIDRANIGVVRTDTPDRYGADSNRHYEGKSGNGSIKVNIRSSFGRIVLGEATDADMKKSSKSYDRNAGKVI